MSDSKRTPARKAKSKKKTGRKKVTLGEKAKRQVQGLARWGMSVKAIASIIEVSETVLRREAFESIEMGRAEAHMQMGEVLFQSALKVREDSKYSQLAMFYASTQMGWVKRERVELSGPGEEPITIENAGAKDLLREKLKTRVERQATEIIEAAEDA